MPCLFRGRIPPPGWHRRPMPHWPIPGHCPCPSDGPAGEHPTSPLGRLAAFPNPGMCHVQDRHLEKRPRQQNRKLEISPKTRNFVEISSKFRRKRRSWFMIYPFCCHGGMYVSFLYAKLDLRLVIMLPAYACSMFASLPRTPSTAPCQPPAMCRPLSLPISVRGARTHVGLAPRTL